MSILNDHFTKNNNYMMLVALATFIFFSVLGQSFSEEFSNQESFDNIIIPDWFKNNALWWEAEEITDAEIVSAIGFMINEKIIILSSSEEGYFEPYVTSQDKDIQDLGISGSVKEVFGFWGLGLASDDEIGNAMRDLMEQETASFEEPDQQPNMRPVSIGEEILVMDGEKMQDGWRQAVDPSIVKINDQWNMFFSSQDVDAWVSLEQSDPLKSNGPRIFILLASLPPGKSIGETSWEIHKKDGEIYPILSPGSIENDDWDSHATETPKYVLGYDSSEGKWVERIYYTGWDRTNSKQPDYAIGFAQRESDSDVWTKHPNPIMVGTEPWEKFNGISAIGDQAVLYEPGSGPNGSNGIWHMWYQAYDGKDGSIVHASSKDGVVWSKKQKLEHEGPFPGAKPSGGPYSLDVFVHNDKFTLFGWIPSKDLMLQGIWRTVSDDAVEGYDNWRPIVYENNGVKWHDSGLEGSGCHKTGLYGPTAVVDENNELWVFYHGVRAEESINPCIDLSTNVASIGKVSIGQCDSESCRFVE